MTMRHRVEGRGFIRWYVDNRLVAEVTTESYYRTAHIHRAGCTCDALVHDAAFHEKLRAALRPLVTSVTA